MKARTGIGMLAIALAALVMLAPAGAQQPGAPAGKDAPTKDAPKGGKKVKQSAVITMEKGGEIAIEFFPDDAPKTVENFVTLAKKGFYDGVTFHRVEPNFVVQGGDPYSRGGEHAKGPVGTGGPGYKIKCETTGNPHKHAVGSLSMAHAGKDTGGSQFFLVLNEANTRHLNGVHTVFGRIVEGLEFLPDIKQNDELTSARVD